MTNIDEKQSFTILLDNWLSKLIGKQTYYLKSFSDNLVQKDLPKGKIFLWTKVDVDNIKSMLCLQNLGFYIVDTNIQLSLSKKIYFKNNPYVRFAKLEDELQIRNLAKNSFKDSRFYKDPNISLKIASKIKEEWAANFFRGNRGRWMIVVEQDSKVVGFLQIIDKNQSGILIDLITVDNNYRNRGLAKDMISYAYAKCIKNNGIVEVGTQVTNIKSINMYTKIGFVVNSANYILHKDQRINDNR